MTTDELHQNDPSADPPVPWARRPVAASAPATGRTRRMVDGLPAWEPLPPGEILVQRTRGRGAAT